MYRALLALGIVIVTTGVIVSAQLAPKSHPAPGSVVQDTQPAVEKVSGTIYCRPWLGEGRVWAIRADGQGGRELPEGVGGEPSRSLHRGQRWFLTTREIAGETYPNGDQRRELYLVTEGGSSIRLTCQSDLEPLAFQPRWPAQGQDRLVAWIARRHGAQGQIVEGGIYTGKLMLDADGAVVGLVDPPAGPRLPIPLVPSSPAASRADQVPDICAFDWSPDGTSIVYESLNQELFVVHADTNKPRLLVERRGCDPAWSHDGSTISFKLVEPFGEIAMIRPDGTGLACAVPGCPGSYTVTHPIPAPGGSALAYTRFQIAGATTDHSSGIAGVLCVATAHGDPYEIATGDHLRQHVPFAWR